MMVNVLRPFLRFTLAVNKPPEKLKLWVDTLLTKNEICDLLVTFCKLALMVAVALFEVELLVWLVILRVGGSQGAL